jgi:predicted XRE-type DNA-binding protein
MEEIWVDVIGYEGLYQVSNFGRVKSLDRIINSRKRKGKILSNNKTNGNGYIICTLCKNDTQINHYVHRLVASAFCKKECDTFIVNHIDSNIKNNRSDNLEWISAFENVHHYIKKGRKTDTGTNSPNTKLTEVDLEKIRFLLKNTKLKQHEIAKQFNVAQTTISRIKLGKTFKEFSGDSGDL